MSDKTNENKPNENELKENNQVDNNKEIKKEKIKSNKEEIKSQKNKKEKNENKSFAREALEWIVCIVVAFTLALIIKYFLFTPTLVMQQSMTPTILNEERVLINRLVRTFNLELNRGDIITFEAPLNYELADGEITAQYREVDGVIDSLFYNVMEVGKISYIKRVIGVSGDKIEFRNGRVYVNDIRLEEDYLPEGAKTYLPEKGMPNSFIVPEGYIFAMGDNREGSSDCRAFGCIPIEKVEGRVSIRIWPLNKFGGIEK